MWRNTADTQQNSHSCEEKGNLHKICVFVLKALV